MSATRTATSPRQSSSTPPSRPLSRRDRRALHRRLRDQERLSARLVELRAIAELCERAEALVRAGWVQDAWFGYPGADGPRLSHLPGGLNRSVVRAADRFCLVGAIRAAGGGGAGRQLVDRTVDTVWRTLVHDVHGDPDVHEVRRVPLATVPPPQVRVLRTLDLTRWNDRRGRTSEDVRDLLRRAAAYAGQEWAVLSGRTIAQT